MRTNTPEPDMGWYLGISRERGVTPRCPFASVDRCPRYYDSLWLLGQAGSTKIPPDETKRLNALWAKSDLRPRTAEGETSISGSDGKHSIFSNFCPEVTYDRFGVFAAVLADYADELDRDVAHEQLGRSGVSGAKWHWRWASLKPLHFTECPLYSPLTASAGIKAPRAIPVIQIGTNINSPIQQGAAGATMTQTTTYSGDQINDLRRLVTHFDERLGELQLGADQERKARAQLATIKVQLDDEPDPVIVKQAGRTLRNVTEAAIGGLIAAAAQPSVWQWVQGTMSLLFGP